MDPLIRRPAPMLVAPLRSVLAVAANPYDLVCGLGGLLATLADTGVQVRVTCGTPGGELEPLGKLHAAAHELDADEVVAVPPVDGPGAGGIEDRIEGVLADSDAVLVVGADEGADEGRRRVRVAASTAAARHGRLLLEWLGPHDLPARHYTAMAGTWSEPSDVFTLVVDRSRQRRAAGRFAKPADPRLEATLEATGRDRVRAHHAPYGPRLGRLRERLRPLLRPDAAPRERRETLHVLAAFARGRDWPQELLSGSPGSEPASHALHEDPSWSLASVVLRAGQATAPHRHDSWGAAVTIVGVERNLRYAG